jgi:hypothetical protein
MSLEKKFEEKREKLQEKLHEFHKLNKKEIKEFFKKRFSKD